MRSLLLLVLYALLAATVHAAPPATPSSVVSLDTDAMRAIGLRTVTLKPRNHRQTLSAYGDVVPLTTLLHSSQTLAQAKARQRQATAKVAASHVEYQRLQGLFKQHANVSRRQLEAARATWESDGAMRDQAVSSLQAVRSTLRARWGAVIARWLRSRSQHFQALVKGAARLIHLTVPGHTQLRSPPQHVQILLADGPALQGDWVSRSPSSVDGQQGVSFYAWADTAVDRLGYGARVEGRIPEGAARRGVIVPASAVVWSGGSAWIYTRIAKGRFRRTPLSTREPTAEGWFEPHAPKAGEQVVTQGAQMLLSKQEKAVAPPKTDDDDD